MSFYIIFLPLILFFLAKYNYFIAEKIKLLDKPGIETHKKHLSIVPATGGLFIIISLIYYELINLNLHSENINYLFLYISFFLIGLLDDIFKIKSYQRLLILLIISYLYLWIDSEIIITNFYSDIYQKIYYTNAYSVVFTVLCFVTIYIILNMLDGIDGLMIVYSLSIFTIFLILKFNFFIFLLVLILLFLLVLNLKKKLFLGNNGVGILSAIIGYNLITYSNLSLDKLSELKILILLFLPFIDFLRLTVERIIKRKNPLKGDNNHFHHFFFKNNYYLLFVPFFIFLTYTVSLWNSYFVLLISISVYFILLYKFRYKNV